MLTKELVLKAKTLGTVLSATVLVLFSATASHAYDGPAPGMAAGDKARELEGVGIDEKLGTKLDLGMKFKDESGHEVTLGSFFDGKHPVIISPVYFSCPGLCNFHLNGLTDALKGMSNDWSVGGRFKVISVSFDPRETADLAAKKKAVYMKLYGREGTEKSWHFLTTDETSAKAITTAVGFKYHWDENEKQWAHASTAVVVSPTGVITRYLPGIMFDPKDVKLALNEATEGKIGTFVDGLVLYCFQYNPHQGKYAVAAVNIMKLGGGLTVLVMALWFLPIFIRSRRAGKIKRGDVGT